MDVSLPAPEITVHGAPDDIKRAYGRISREATEARRG
jgi:hypothetical protein